MWRKIVKKPLTYKTYLPELSSLDTSTNPYSLILSFHGLCNSSDSPWCESCTAGNTLSFGNAFTNAVTRCGMTRTANKLSLTWWECGCNPLHFSEISSGYQTKMISLHATKYRIKADYVLQQCFIIYFMKIKEAWFWRKDPWDLMCSIVS